MGLYAFDGTNQDDADTGAGWAAVSHDTNIFRFYSAYQGYASASPDVRCDYVPGVGTRFGVFGAALWPNACPPQSPSLHFLQHDSPVAPSSVVSKTLFNTQ